MGAVELTVELIDGVSEHLQGDEPQSRIQGGHQGSSHILGPFVTQG